MSAVYPDTINLRLQAVMSRKRHANADAAGKAAAIECGTFAVIGLIVDHESRTIEKIEFSGNGCGYMLAAADVLIEDLERRRLTDLHGLKREDLRHTIEAALGPLPAGRLHCAETVINAIRDAFAKYRASRVEEFTGEKALICTCFGVTEQRIDNAIRQQGARTLDDVTRLTNAGSGCGSCQMLIRELIDVAEK